MWNVHTPFHKISYAQKAEPNAQNNVKVVNNYLHVVPYHYEYISIINYRSGILTQAANHLHEIGKTL